MDLPRRRPRLLPNPARRTSNCGRREPPHLRGGGSGGRGRPAEARWSSPHPCPERRMTAATRSTPSQHGFLPRRNQLRSAPNTKSTRARGQSESRDSQHATSLEPQVSDGIGHRTPRFMATRQLRPRSGRGGLAPEGPVPRRAASTRARRGSVPCGDRPRGDRPRAIERQESAPAACLANKELGPPGIEPGTNRL